MQVKYLKALLLAAVTLGAASALAVDGVIEINQACAVNTGCFSGDGAGFPVEIDGTAGLSYRLTGDLQIPNEGTTGILISANGISVDLNGFAIRGVTLCFGSPPTCAPLGIGDGVAITTGPFQGIEVRNGIVMNMGNAGLALGGGARVENVRAIRNGGVGIGTSFASVVTGCAAVRNGGEGISVGRGSTVSASTASSNGGNGIFSDAGSTISTCSAYNNNNTGIYTGTGSTVRDNLANNNGDDGIYGSAGSTMRGNSASGNANRGIGAFRDTLISANSTSYNGDGQATDDGISCESGGCLVEHNTSGGNDGFGIRFSGATSGYRANVTRNNTGGAVSGGTDLGDNLLN
jgi:hypothetical protein